jgi:hypothetical protein
MKQLGPIRRRQNQGLPFNEFPGVLKGGVSILQPFGHLSIPFPGCDTFNLPADLNALSHTIHGDDAFGAVKKGSSDGGCSPQNVYDNYDTGTYVV